MQKYASLYPLKTLLQFVLILSFHGACKSQLAKDYKPFSPTNSIPLDFIVDIKNDSEKKAENSTLLSKKIAINYYSELFSIKKQLFESGDIYLPNPLTKYIDSISDALLKTESKSNQIKFFLTRYSSANAFCLADGSIFVNIGLINTLENESELAFVLAHEIAHFILQHNIKDFSKAIAIKQKETSNSGFQSTTFRKLRFSRESELEADSYALSLMTTAGYETSMALNALGKLKSTIPSEEIDLEKMFNNSFFTLDTSFHAKALLKKVKEGFAAHSQNKADSKVDDLYETHPDLDKRIASIKELERNLKANNTKRSNSNYTIYKTLAAFETCNNNLKEQDYINAILNSNKLLSAYPNNIYLMAIISKSLYWISYYKELSKDELKIYGDLNQNPVDFYLLYTMFDMMSLKETKRLAYAFLRSREDSIAHFESLYFYLALSTENYLGKIAANDFYKNYQIKFPEGSYSAFVKGKLK